MRYYIINTQEEVSQIIWLPFLCHVKSKPNEFIKIIVEQIYASIHEKAKAENGKSLPPRIQLNEMKL